MIIDYGKKILSFTLNSMLLFVDRRCTRAEKAVLA